MSEKRVDRRTVWKYKITVQKNLRMLMPRDAKILSVGKDKGELVLWAEVKAHYKETEVRYFQLVGTGRSVPPAAEYVGTLIDGPHSVWHVYETLG